MFAVTARRRAAVAMGVGLLTASLAMAAPGADAAGLQACQFNGATTSLTPIPASGPSSGSYTFSGTGTCAGAATGPIAITVANGHYDNSSCGTGTATGTADVTGAVNATLGFTLTLVSGQGVLTIGSGGSGAGVASLVPNAGGCVTAPVQSFSVTGTIAGMF
jgi:hypothetical protein